MRRICVFVSLFILAAWSSFAVVPPKASAPDTASSPTASRLENTFASGWIVQDSNGDGINDAVHAQVIVPAHSSAAENAAAADIAARIGYETAGITLPIVFTATDAGTNGKDFQVNPKIWIGMSAIPADETKRLPAIATQLGSGEGGWFSVGGNLAVVGTDPVGLLAAAAAYSSRAPYQWSVPGDKIEGIAKTINEALQKHHIDGKVELIGVTYSDGQAGIRRAVLRLSGNADVDELHKALAEGDSPVHFSDVHELYFIGASNRPLSIFNPNPLSPAAMPAAPEGGSGAEQMRLLDLGTLYGVKGLLNGSAKKPIPSAVAAKLYVPTGAAGVAMANLAARLGLETTGITLPLAVPAEGVSPAEVHSTAVLAGDSLLSHHVSDLLTAAPGSDLDKADLPAVGAKPNDVQSPALAPGEGELRVVDGAFGKNAALIARGDEQGSAAAISYAASHLPNLWEYGKQYESIDEMGYDLHRFFSLRSGVGQASAAMYHLDRWLTELAGDKAHPNRYSDVEADVYVDVADPGLENYVKKTIAEHVQAGNVTVHVGSLHAGMKCCDSDPPLYYKTISGTPFHPAKPTFEENLTIPWEGTRLLAAVKKAVAGIKPGEAVEIEARVSEGPAERDKLQEQIRGLLQTAGADVQRSQVIVLCAYKQGYSWIMDQVAPDLLKVKPARVVISFAPYKDKLRMSALGSPSRWVQELYPVDEVLAKRIGIPLAKVELAELPDANGPTYRVTAYSEAGAQVYTKDFTVSSVERTYSPTFPNYDHVTVETGWLHATDNGRVLADERIETDLEEFWDHYQSDTLPRIYKYIVAQNNGKPRQEYQPLFDTLKVSIKMSEPDYDIGLDQERISSLEAVQEDTLFSTENFFYMLGSSESNGIMDYMGRVIPVVYPSRDGQDGTVHIEFYGKDAAHPLVRLRWKKQADAPFEEKARDLPAVNVGEPRLVAARVQAGAEGVRELTWRLLADSRNDDFQEWRKVARQEQIERSMLSVEQGQGEVRALEAMHNAGLYRNALEYPHLGKLSVEFELPLELGAPEHAKAEVVNVAWAVQPPATRRPMIADLTPAPVDAAGNFVSWDEPIGTGQSARILARLAKYPGVNVYWMGRSYLGQNIWAADIMLPSPSQMRSMAKETTLKAAIIYSGRQHANEVSSTSHILKLAEQLVTDPATREKLKKVNVVVHPITNPDGADLAMDLAKITPENMLHPGYHGSLTADVVTAQWDPDPVYPESRTRRQLWEAWLPDAFLNPHGYPSHEWVQPFSEYAAWVINRYGADAGRAWWISRGWFTSLNYLRDEEHPHSKDVAYALRQEIASSMAATPGVLDMNKLMNARYERFGQKWDEKDFQQPIYEGVRVYMALKGEKPSPRSPSFLARYPDVTWDDGYTEAPDETARGAWLHLVASAGLAFDRTHLNYLANAKFKIKRTHKEFFNGVSWKVDRDRPVLPEKPPAGPEMKVAE